MADPVFNNLTYAGELFEEVFGPAVLDPAGLIENELATPLDQTKFKTTLNEVDDTVVLQDPSATFSDQSTTGEVDEVNVEAVPYEFHKELAWDNIRKSWQNYQLAPGSLNDYEASEITQQFLQEVYVPKLKLANNHLVLRGKNDLDSAIGSYTFGASYSGLYERFAANASIGKLSLAADQITISSVSSAADPTVLQATGVDVTGDIFVGNTVTFRNAAGTGWSALNTDLRVLSVELSGSDTLITVDLDTSTLTAGNYTANSADLRYINRNNIIHVMSNHLGFVPDVVRRNGAKIVLPEHLEMEWQFANAEAQKNGGAYYLSSYQMNMIDQRVVILDSAQPNTIGTWEAKRVGYAFDLSNDASNVELLWQGDRGDKTYRLRGAMKTGTQITTLFPQEITLTTPDKD